MILQLFSFQIKLANGVFTQRYVAGDNKENAEKALINQMDIDIENNYEIRIVNNLGDIII